MANNSSYTVTWGKNFLRAIGAPYNIQTDLFLRAWAQAEGTTADFNPFATTLAFPGAVQKVRSAANPDGDAFNIFTAGNGSKMSVWHYPTWQMGVQYTAETIMDGRYNGLLREIRAGKDAKAMAVALRESPWGTGALTLKVLQYTPKQWPWGNCYPIPATRFTRTIKPMDTGADVDELLRCIAKKAGIGGYKWYSTEAVAWVKSYQKARPELGAPDGVVGPLTWKSITGHS